MKLSRIAPIVVGSMACLTLVGTAVAQTVVMDGLDNPRGLAFAPNGALYVAEAGRGGNGPCLVNPGSGEERCYGKSGAITRLWKGQQSRVIEGLESHAMPDGSSASGPTDISFQGTGGAYITLGLGGGPDFKADLGNKNGGTLIHMAASGKWKVVADILQHEVDENPAGGPIDSNPFGVLAEPGGRLVVDAGMNALLRVAANGKVETVAVFPPLPNPLFPNFGPPTVESVPTAVARGPAGALYVGELTGFPFVQGLASVYRVEPGQAPVQLCTGFKAIIDLAFAPDGGLYVVENATGPFPPPPPFAPNSGRLSHVGMDCTVTPLLTGLDRPTAVVVGKDGAVYVTNHGVTPGEGQVLMIAP
jgi:hypothetical protein